MTISFSEKFAKILGFAASKRYHLTGEDTLSTAEATLRCDKNVNYFILHVDIVEPSRYSSQYSSVIDIIPGPGFQTRVKSTLYKSLRSLHEITSISVVISDENGNEVYFPDDISVVAIFHIRPKP